MKFTADEMGLLNYSVRLTDQMTDGQAPTGEIIKVPQQRKFEQLKELPLAISIIDKLDKNVVEGKFVEGELKFTTEEKAKLLSYLNRPWVLADGKVYLTLKPKLE